MELTPQIHQFIKQPFPLWETTLTHQLVQQQWAELKGKGFTSSEDYSTARVWLNKPSLKLDKRKPIPKSSFCVEMPSAQLQWFYDEHGLELLTENEIETDAVLLKLNKAFSILRLIDPIYDCITDLVQAIHILRQPDADIDLSYSHPQIPFSIFISVCNDDSVISNLRVAESILHEAMHLKLTLIENNVSLIKPNTKNLYYSPWREELRPIQGVLHGLFVFRAIYEFYKRIINEFSNYHELNKFLITRIDDIIIEINQLVDLKKNKFLDKNGRKFITNLMET